MGPHPLETRKNLKTSGSVPTRNQKKRENEWAHTHSLRQNFLNRVGLHTYTPTRPTHLYTHTPHTHPYAHSPPPDTALRPPRPIYPRPTYPPQKNQKSYIHSSARFSRKQKLPAASKKETAGLCLQENKTPAVPVMVLIWFILFSICCPKRLC